MPFSSFCRPTVTKSARNFSCQSGDEFETWESFIKKQKLNCERAVIFIPEISQYKGSLLLSIRTISCQLHCVVLLYISYTIYTSYFQTDLLNVRFPENSQYHTTAIYEEASYFHLLDRGTTCFLQGRISNFSQLLVACYEVTEPITINLLCSRIKYWFNCISILMIIFINQLAASVKHYQYLVSNGAAMSNTIPVPV